MGQERKGKPESADFVSRVEDPRYEWHVRSKEGSLIGVFEFEHEAMDHAGKVCGLVWKKDKAAITSQDILEKEKLMGQCLYKDAGKDKFDIVKKAAHYNQHPSGIECIDIVKHMSFTLGNVIKYTWRSDLKNGIQDLEKAKYYLECEIAKRRKEMGS